MLKNISVDLEEAGEGVSFRRFVSLWVGNSFAFTMSVHTALFTLRMQ